jgi:flagellar FliL protein
MAEVAAAQPAAKEKPKPEANKKDKRKLLLFVAIGAVLVLAGGGAATYLMLSGEHEGNGAEVKVESKKMPVFLDLDQFTVNLRADPDSDDGERFIQVKLVAELKDSASGEVLKTMMPSIRNEILLLLGGKTADELAQREGKEQLARDIVAAVNRPLEGTSASGAVLGVNFTHLIIQ